MKRIFVSVFFFATTKMRACFYVDFVVALAGVRGDVVEAADGDVGVSGDF
jgi:hypothetical protein